MLSITDEAPESLDRRVETIFQFIQMGIAGDEKNIINAGNPLKKPSQLFDQENLHSAAAAEMVVVPPTVTTGLITFQCYVM
jgi:hypothetical protein